MCIQTHSYKWFHCTVYPYWKGQLANTNNSPMTEKSQTHGHEDQAWQNGKSKTGMRKRNRKTGTKSVHPKQNVVSNVQWEGDGCGMIAILQKTRRAPSCHTNREAGLEREDTFFHNNHRGSQPCHYPGQQSRGTPEPRRQSMRCQAFVCLRRLLQWRKR